MAVRSTGIPVFSSLCEFWDFHSGDASSRGFLCCDAV